MYHHFLSLFNYHHLPPIFAFISILIFKSIINGVYQFLNQLLTEYINF